MSLKSLARLVVPVNCPGCGLEDVRWCTDCLAPTRTELARRDAHVPRLDRLDGRPVPVWGLVDYAGSMRDVVVAWKDRSRADLTDPFARELRRAVALGAADIVPTRTAVTVVPVPSAAASQRARGWSPVAGLTQAAMVGLRRAGIDATVADLLQVQGRSRDQVGLGIRARAGNRTRSIRVRPRAARRVPANSLCILVDDIVTTGATLAACTDALRLEGFRPACAVVLAATPAPGVHPIPTEHRGVAVSRRDGAG